MVWDQETMNQRAPGILLGMGAIALCLGLREMGLLERFELAVHDRLLVSKRDADSAPSPVVTISIGEDEFQRYGYPIPDSILAKALATLIDQGVSAVGIDLYRDGPASGAPADLEGWAVLADVIASRPRIVVSELLASDDRRGIFPPSFARTEQVGFNNLLLDPGRVVRRGYMLAWDASDVPHQSLSLRLALRYLAGSRIGLGAAPENPEWVRLGGTTVPPLESDFGAYHELDAGGYQFALDYAPRPEAFETVTFESIVEGTYDAEKMRGRVAIVGTDAPSVKDDFNAPYARDEAVKGYRIHAHVTDQMIRMGQGNATPQTSWSEWAEVGWVVLWGLGGLGLSAFIGSLGWAVPGFALGLGILGLATAALFSAGTWVPTVAPAMAWLSAGGLAAGDRARREARDQRQLMSLFRRFSSRKVADSLWSRRDEFMDGNTPRPQRITITALLSDLKGYTAAAEKMDPDQLMEWIDSYMDAMTRVIEAHDGHVDDYVGDGIKANFGVPVPSETEAEIARDADLATRCAIKMGETLEGLNGEWSRRGWPTGRQRIGLFTGTAVVGGIGSEERTKFTTIGDTINTAARLEGIGGALDFDQETALQRILIGARTRSLIGDAFEIEDVGQHAVKGKMEPLQIYRVHGFRQGSAEEKTK